jgi:hypothetical protein
MKERTKERKLSALLFLDLEGEYKNNNFFITRVFSTDQAQGREKKAPVLPAAEIPHVYTKVHGTTKHNKHSMTTVIKCTTPLRWSRTACEPLTRMNC